MLRRGWQRTMIRLARSSRAKAFMQSARSTTRLARQYVAGPTAADGVARAQALLRGPGARSSLFYLGEYVDTPSGVDRNLAGKRAVIAALAATDLDLHVSMDPTQVGYGIDPAGAEAHIRALATAIARAAGTRPGVHCAMLDMEDQSVTDATIAIHDRLRGEGLPMALTLQAYLRRTEADLAAQIRAGSRVRLVNGAFAAGAEVAFPSRRAIKANYRRLIAMMFSAEARDRGFYPILATHDDRLHAFALEQAAANGWPADRFEFEMLLGVRGDVAGSLARAGHRVRLYVPFGEDWWPHAVRRIGENPRNAWLLARSVLSGRRSAAA